MADYNNSGDSACAARNNFVAWSPFSCSWLSLSLGGRTIWKEFRISARVHSPPLTCFWLRDIEQYPTPWVSIFFVWETYVNKTKIPIFRDFSV